MTNAPKSNFSAGLKTGLVASLIGVPIVAGAIGTIMWATHHPAPNQRPMLDATTSSVQIPPSSSATIAPVTPSTTAMSRVAAVQTKPVAKMATTTTTERPQVLEDRIPDSNDQIEWCESHGEESACEYPGTDRDGYDIVVPEDDSMNRLPSGE